jgi:CHAT domain-containing protein
MDMTAAEVAYGLRARIDASSPETSAVLELDLAEVHAIAGDLDGALQQCDQAVAHSANSPLALQATAYAEALQFDRAVQERRGEVAPVDWSQPVFGHPAHWAGFIVVGDWRSSMHGRG